MSVQFVALDATGSPVGGSVRLETGCLCAQCAPSWSHYLEGTDRAELREHANPGCPFCGGSGVELEERRNLFLDLANENACAFFGLLGIETGELFGAMSVLRARAAIAHARRTFGARARAFTRDPVETSFSRASSGNVVDLHARPRVHLGGLVLEGLEARLERFEAFVDDACNAGAVSITWS